jgi:putative transcriptional regulator
MQYIFDIMQCLYYTMQCKEETMKNKKMKIARMECDMKQDDLAKAVGVTRQTISLIEAGGYNPTLNLCIAICKALGKTLNDLFWEES